MTADGAPDTPLRRIIAQAKKYDGEDHAAARLTVAAYKRLEYRRRHSGKTCSKCERDLPLSMFSRDSSARDGLRRYCRECDADGYRARASPRTLAPS